LPRGTCYGFLPIGGAIVALYILRLRRRRVEVPAVLLWTQVLQDFQANAPWQRLRKHWLLLVQLLAALLLVLGVHSLTPAHGSTLARRMCWYWTAAQA
jgi:hypothetical protein